MIVRCEKDPALRNIALRGAALPIDRADLHGELGLIHNLAVNGDAQHDGLVARTAVAADVDLNNVFGVMIDGVPQFDRAVSRFANTVVVIDEPGLRKRIATDGTRGDLLGRLKILLGKRGRDGEDVADVIEAVTGIVGRKFFGGAEIDAKQVADRIRVFVTVQAVGDRAAGIGLLVLIGFCETSLDHGDEVGNSFR